MDRRRFVTTAALAGAAGTLAACGGSSPSGAACGDGAAAGGERFEWKMVTAWPRDFPGLGTGANRLAEYIGRLSGGRLKVKVYGGGELVPPFEVFDAVSRGTAEMGHSTSYYWKGKTPATQFFSAVPFGLNAQEMNAWLYADGGLQLWQELYAAFGLTVFPAGNTGVQMAGWFNQPIRSVSDLKGLKMRMPGLGAEVLQRAGSVPVSLPGGDIFLALQKGTIDATEWIGPMNDMAFGLHKAAKYYYAPGWHEPATTIECLISQKSFQALPQYLQHAVERSCQIANQSMLVEFTYQNQKALQVLKRDKNIILAELPLDVLKHLKQLSVDVVADIAKSDPFSRKVYDAYRSFSQTSSGWQSLSEFSYLKARV